jgi:hypothetical protein
LGSLCKIFSGRAGQVEVSGNLPVDSRAAEEVLGNCALVWKIKFILQRLLLVQNLIPEIKSAPTRTAEQGKVSCDTDLKGGDLQLI